MTEMDETTGALLKRFRFDPAVVEKNASDAYGHGRRTQRRTLVRIRNVACRRCHQ